MSGQAVLSDGVARAAWLAVLAALVFAASLNPLLTLYYHYMGELGPYIHGDWLINFAAGPVRRGFPGEALILVSDHSGVALRELLVGLQAGLHLGLILLWVWLCSRLSDGRLLLALMLNPAFFLMFWMGDPLGAYRKELLAYLALALAVLACCPPQNRESSDRWWMIWLSISLLFYGLAVLSHEGNVFFLPSLALITFIAARNNLVAATSFIGLQTVLSLFAIYFAVRFSRLDDYGPICDALLSRGLSEQICSGAIGWLKYDTRYALNQVRGMLMSPAAAQYALMFVAASAWIYSVAAHVVGKRRALVLLMMTALSFVPLYVVAVDWGRWINFSVTAATFIIIAIVAVENRPVHYRFPLWQRISFCFVPFVAMTHHLGLQGGVGIQLARRVFAGD